MGKVVHLFICPEKTNEWTSQDFLGEKLHLKRKVSIIFILVAGNCYVTSRIGLDKDEGMENLH